uniref:NADH-ubiquinone oxidoreductase chain 4 n=1 Tax=Ptiliidae sp. BMNH 1274723 TaxID=1796536 RepID=A0A126TGC9_9COLE|nr:NADH dehydrogenase subunit 4 [Ptiliidae sp. BMNH 1274723]
MMFIVSVLFLIPMVYLTNFWLVQIYLFFYSFIFLINLKNLIFMNSISYYFGVDLISFILIWLSFWIISLMFMSSEKLFKLNYYYNLFSFLLLLLMIMLLLLFCSMNLIMFYIYFEISMVPMLILILGWGYQPERVQAGLYLLIYTLLASFPLFLMIIYFYMNCKSLDFYYLLIENSVYIYFFTLIVFLVKLPMFMVHLWLPKAHVEAPVSGSMILAGVMLKLGGYGLFRVIFKMKFMFEMNIYLIIFSLVGSAIISMLCIRQIDMKSLVAYSSVAHMGMVLSGLLSLTLFGWVGSFIILLSHGLCSSGLFVLVNILYERLSSRSLLINKGLINIIPSLTMWWFLFSVINMSAPPSLNLFGEIFIIISIMWLDFNMIYMMLLILFFGGVYSLYLFSYSQHGKLYSGVYSMMSIKLREFLILFLHLVPLLMLFLKMDLLFLF